MMRRHAKPAAAVLFAVALTWVAVPAFAHGIGGRYSLPVPLNFFLIGAAAVVAMSFVMIGIFVQERPSSSVRYWRYDLLSVRLLRGVLTGRVTMALVQAASVFVFGLVLATSLFGENLVFSNFTPTFVWIIWWTGMVFASAFLGDVWAVVNPWNIMFRWAEKLLGLDGSPILRFPPWLGVWPALVLFWLFAWIESNYARAGEPRILATLIIVYSLITWGGMLLFGRHEWLRRGEAFSKLFGYFAKFAPTEVRTLDTEPCATCHGECSHSPEDCVNCHECFALAPAEQRQLNLRLPGVGLARNGAISIGELAFVVLLLSTVTFDGFTATGAWSDFRAAVQPKLSFLGDAAPETVGTFGLAMFPIAFLAAYFCFCWAMGRISGESVRALEVCKMFLYSLIPIALAYHVAHFLVLLLIQGQTILPLASDPFGWGWDLFGLSGYTIYPLVTTRFEWFLSIVAIVSGHVIAVYLAHVVALRRFATHTGALRSQYPMLLLMLLYTATSLWIVAQPIVAEG